MAGRHLLTALSLLFVLIFPPSAAASSHGGEGSDSGAMSDPNG